MPFLDVIWPGEQLKDPPLSGFEIPVTIAIVALIVAVVVLLIVKNKRK